jgi:V/A-type H+-transporting ATPase subunit I
MLAEMTKIHVVGSRGALDTTVRALHRLGTVQIEDSTGDLPPSESVLHRLAPRSEERGRVEALLTRVGAAIRLLPELPPGAGRARSVNLLAAATQGDVESVLHEVEPLCADLTARRSELDAELAGLRQYRTVISKLRPIAEGLITLEGFETTAILVQRKYRVALDLLRAELERITHGQSEIVAADVDEESAAAIVVYSRTYSGAVRSLLSGENLNDVRLPSAYVDRPFAEALRLILQREAEIPHEQQAVAARLEAVATEWRPRLVGLAATLRDHLDELAVHDKLAGSRHVFLLTGWVRRRDLERTRAEVAAASREVEVVEVELSSEELAQAPVFLDNPRVVRPFEFLMGILTPPRYGTIDPTPIMAVCFPLFFGMILGDVAYGLVLFALASWVVWRRRRPAWLVQLGRVMLISSASAIAFGFAYGEFLGNLGEHFGMRPLIVDRMTAIVPVLLFSIALGAVQVLLGLVLGIVNAYLERERAEILEKAAMIVALTAIFGLVGVISRTLPPNLMTPSIVLLSIALVVLIYTLGIVGPLEVFGVVGNILSYSRLMAIGLASVILARVANDLADMVGSVVLGVIVAALLHALNIALGAMSPSIQSARLHYVEFFTKFYKTGGRPFRPFRLSDAAG